MERSFGLGVLLKLTKKNIKGIEISTDGDHFSSNIPLSELSTAVDTVLEIHNIRLETE